MKLYKVLAIIGLASLSLASCQKKYAEYEPAAKETGAQYYFSNSIQTYVKLTPDTESIDVEVLRIDDAAAGTANISVSDESKVIVAEGEKTISVPFAQGAKKATLSLPVDMDEIEFGDKFSLILKITGETTQYAISEVTIVAEFPEPWVSLGKGVFTDNFWYEESKEVEIQQNQVAPNQFRIVDPFSAMAAAIGSEMSGDEADYAYLYFRVLQPGEVLSDVTVTEEDLVYFSSTSTGYYYANYDAIIWIHHPIVFSNTHTEEFWLHNVVLSYQENGLPGIIQLAPRYYMDGVGGWGYSQADGVASIVFPGVVLADYSAEISYEGLLTDKYGDNYIVASAELGEDVEYAKVVAVPSYGEGDKEAVEEALALIEEDGENVVTIETSGDVTLPFPEELAEYYLLVIVPFGGDEAQIDDAAYDLFQFKDFGITLTLAEPETDFDGNGSVKATVGFGEDTEAALIAIAPGKGTEGALEALNLILSGDDSVIFLEEEGDVTIDIEGEGDFTVVAVSYAAGDTWNLDYDSFEYFAVSPWEPLGYVLYTDNTVLPWYGVAPIQYYVPIEKNNDVEGLFRLVDIYTKYHPYNDGSEYDPNKTYYTVIDATDPDLVIIPISSTGCDWGYGIMQFGSLGAFYLQYYSVDVIISNAGDIFGKYKDGIISFPASAMYVADDEGSFAGNDAAGWSMDLNAIVDEIPVSSPAPAQPFARKASTVSVKTIAAEKCFNKELKPSAVSVAKGKVAGMGKKAKLDTTGF